MVYHSSELQFRECDFTDESRFQFYRCTRKRWAKFGHCQKMVPKLSQAVTVWGGISKFDLTPLVSVNGNFSAIEYCKILGKGLLLSNIVTNDLPYVVQRQTAHCSLYPRLVHTESRDRNKMVCCFPRFEFNRNCLADHERSQGKNLPENITDWKVTIMETWIGLDENYIDSFDRQYATTHRSVYRATRGSD